MEFHTAWVVNEAIFFLGISYAWIVNEAIIFPELLCMEEFDNAKTISFSGELVNPVIFILVYVS